MVEVNLPRAQRAHLGGQRARSILQEAGNQVHIVQALYVVPLEKQLEVVCCAAKLFRYEEVFNAFLDARPFRLVVQGAVGWQGGEEVERDLVPMSPGT